MHHVNLFRRKHEVAYIVISKGTFQAQQLFSLSSELNVYRQCGNLVVNCNCKKTDLEHL